MRPTHWALFLILTIWNSSCRQPMVAQEYLNKSNTKLEKPASQDARPDSGNDQSDNSKPENKPVVSDSSSTSPVESEKPNQDVPSNPIEMPSNKPLDPETPKPTDPVKPLPDPKPIPEPTAFDPIAPMPSGKTLRIMPLGASITQGVGSKKAGYRSVLHRLLNEAKVPHVFVGSSKDQPGDLPADQQQHEGHPGWVISTIPGQQSGLQESIGAWVPKAKPDYVLILVGSNDISRSYKLDEIGLRIERLIDSINNKQSGLAKDATVIIASLPLIKDSTQEANSKKYREKIMQVVVKQKKAGMKVGFIDVNSALKSNHMTDNLHPNDAGFEIIGKMWFDRMSGK